MEREMDELVETSHILYKYGYGGKARRDLIIKCKFN